MPAEHIPGYCALCVSRCGCTAVVEDGRFVELRPAPSHPTGQALCAKGRAAPELVYHPDRLQHPLRRTRPKGDPDPGWEPIGWDEALDLSAERLRAIADQSGPETVVFSAASPSTSAICDVADWIDRLRAAFGSPNFLTSMELCGWGRYLAPLYTYGAPVPGVYMPDIERAGCILLWGYNPTKTRLVHATATMAALKRGARLVVVDPRRTGLASRADQWLQVRPGTDAALALGLARVMLERGWYDEAFVRDWTNACLLVRADNGRFLRDGDAYLAWGASGAAVTFDPDARGFDAGAGQPALRGRFDVPTLDGPVACATALTLLEEACAPYTPDRVARITGVDPDQVEATARLLWQERPVAFYTWSGLEMQTGATQTVRAIGVLYALTGSLDVPGGNVLFASVPTARVGPFGGPPNPDTKALGVAERPLGPARFEHVTSSDVYRAILDHEPYPVRGLVGFGANLLLAHADGHRGRRALAALDFYVHADLFMNPTAELADVVLPASSAFEHEALQVGFEVSPEAQSFVQFRPRVAPPPGEARSDMEIIFQLAESLGLGDEFFGGDIDAAYRYLLEPSGIRLGALRGSPAGVSAGLETRHRKYAEAVDGSPRGFATPTGRVELYSETLLDHGYAPLPAFEEPLVGPVARPDLTERYPLVLTCAKPALYCQTQHRALASLRRKAPDPEVEMHPSAAAERGIEAGDWVRIDTPDGSARAKARLNDGLAPGVVCGEHGWWQAAPEIGAPGYDAFGPGSANFNLLIGNDAIDPISGSVPHRAYLCQVTRADEDVASGSA